MNGLKIFSNTEFGQIRTLVIDNEPYFVGKDVAEALGYKNTKDAIASHVDNEDKRLIQKSEIATIENHIPKEILPMNFVNDEFPNRGLIFINESGLYALVFGSKLEAAKRFKHWVTFEVLPMIRKTGSYEMPKKQLSPMELMELQFQALKEVDGKVDAVDRDLQQFKQDMPILGIEESRITAAVRKKGVNCLGGKDSEAYQDRSLRGKVYADIYSQLKRKFGVDTYKAIKRNQSDTAVGVVEGYELPIVLAEQIEYMNSQMDFDDMLC